MSDYGSITEITVVGEASLTRGEIREFRQDGEAIIDCGEIEDVPDSLPQINLEIRLHFDGEEDSFRITEELE